LFAFGVAITEPGQYEGFARPGIDRAKEADSVVLAHSSMGSLCRNYNLLLEEARKIDGLEALVLLHQDTEIYSDDFCSVVREAFSDPDVAIVGCAGSIGVRSIAWWDGAVTWASFVHRYPEYGGGDLVATTWNPDDRPAYATTGEVDSVDGFIMALSPWAVANLEFDETLGNLHGYDFDACCQVREAGKKVVTADFRAIHHHSLDLVSNPDTWVEANIRLIEKWEGRVPRVGQGSTDWKARARRAEAEAGAARAIARKNELERDAVKEMMKKSVSFRLTKPLRSLKGRLDSLRRRRG